jgi:hypothetical protein
MKNSYYFTVDIISNEKSSPEDLETIINLLETDSKSSDLLEPILNNISINFQNYIFINIEDEEFPVNYSDQIEEITNLLEKFLPGGCTIDSRIEWGSDMDDFNLLWFRNKDTWEFSEIENDLRNYGDSDWDEDGYSEDDSKESYW